MRGVSSPNSDAIKFGGNLDKGIFFYDSFTVTLVALTEVSAHLVLLVITIIIVLAIALEFFYHY